MYRIALAGISQETDTFNPVSSVVEDFKKSTFLFGDEILQTKIGNGITDGARVFFSDKRDVEIFPVLMTKCVAGGKLADEAVAFFKEKLVAGLKACLPLDGVFLSVHGATVSDSHDDVSGLLLAATREVVGPDVLIVAPLDHHANITQLIMKSADASAGHETQPHDLFETGKKAASILYRLLSDSKIRPCKAWVNIPMITPQDQFLTSRDPMKSWFDMAREMEKLDGVVSVSPYPMQPWVDAEEGGWSAVVYTHNDEELALDLANRLGSYAWEHRDEFWVSERVDPSSAILRAADAPEGLIVLSDTGDAVYGGGTGDSTCVLEALLAANLPDAAYLPVVDPEAVEEARKTGLGPATLTIGGKNDPFSKPVKIKGRISAISEGLKLTTERGITDIGRTVLFEAGSIRIVLMADRGYAINQPVLYTHLGLKIEDAKMVVLKTGSNFQYFDAWRKGLIRVDSPGTTQSNLKDFTWEKIPRPMYPMDEISSWVPKARLVK
jgi:microcystin degradation protein MlrC